MRSYSIAKTDCGALSLNLFRKHRMNSIAFQDAQNFQHMLATATFQARIADFGKILLFGRIDIKAADIVR